MTPLIFKPKLLLVSSNTLKNMMDVYSTKNFQNRNVIVVKTIYVNYKFMHQIYIYPNAITIDANLGLLGSHSTPILVDLSSYVINQKGLSLTYHSSLTNSCDLGSFTGSSVEITGNVRGSCSFDFFVVDSNGINSNISTVSFDIS
jgi:hypothetical protein